MGTTRVAPTLVAMNALNLPGDGEDLSVTQRQAAEAQMNHSFYSADRTTHLKIVVVALVAATMIAGLGITARVNSGDSYAATDRIQVIKAGQPMMVTTSDQTVVR